MIHTILIVDDEQAVRASLAGILEDEGYAIRQAESGQQALDAVTEAVPDVVLLDIWMEGMDGLETLSRLRRRVPDLPVIMISGHGTIETAVSATHKGAYDFIEKPPQLERLLLTVSRAIREHQLRRENAVLRARSGDVHELLGASTEIAQVRHTIKQVAASESRILISGESGAGKEVVARLIHANSRRKDKLFVALSPAAISDASIDTAFASAFEQAAGGTLFLDEIADLPPAMQARLLRVLQESTTRRDGDARVISSTTRDVKELVDNGSFRADLFYRLNVVPIRIPSLRERSVDVPALVQQFLKSLASDDGQIPAITSAAMAVLTSYTWPGNVRQLRNVIEWLIIMYPGKPILPDMLPAEIRQADSGEDGLLDNAAGLPLREARELFEKNYLTAQLRRFGGNISRTADFIGMERSALHRKLKSLGVESRHADGSLGVPN
jgi:two-component system nitrogen regulation response regulator NtrX